MDIALGPLDIVELSKANVKRLPKPINATIVAISLEKILQKAVNLLANNNGKAFLYKNPNGWRSKWYTTQEDSEENSPDSICITSDDSVVKIVPWALIKDFEYSELLHQINEYVKTWKLTPVTRFVVITRKDKIEHVPPFGDRYFAEVHFSKPTPKCPNPLAVAKVYFAIYVSHILPDDYPVNVTYRFEGHKTEFSVMGEHKVEPNNFQNYFISSILHMKLAFYAKLCQCHNPISPIKLRKNSPAYQS